MTSSTRNGKAIPYGVYDLTHDQGWVSVGIDHDTAEFARRHGLVEENGPSPLSAGRRLLITADGGGSNGTGIAVEGRIAGAGRPVGTRPVCHFPPGTSKWNKIEHRMFCHITQNWRGRPLVSHEVIVKLIASTSTERDSTSRLGPGSGGTPPGSRSPMRNWRP